MGGEGSPPFRGVDLFSETAAAHPAARRRSIQGAPPHEAEPCNSDSNLS